MSVDGAGVRGEILGPAAERVGEFSFPWPKKPAPGETLHFVYQNRLLHVVREGAVIGSTRLDMDRWTESFWRLPSQGDHRLRMQRLAPVLFRDDFMHVEGEFGAWAKTGDWSVGATRNPLRGVNSFQLSVAGVPALLSSGRWFWRDYRFRTAVKCGEGSEFSLSILRGEQERSYEVRVEQGADEAVFRLLRHGGGATREMAVARRPALLGWCSVGVSAIEDLICVETNGEALLQCVDDNPLAFGGIALAVSRLGKGQIVFDDVEVAPVSSIRFDPAEVPASRLCATAREQDEYCLELHNPSPLNSRLGVELNPVSPNEIAGLELATHTVPGEGIVRLTVGQPGEKGTMFALDLTSPTRSSRPLARGHVREESFSGTLQLHERGAEAWVTLGKTLLCGPVGTGREGTVGRASLRLPGGLAGKVRSVAVGGEPQLPALVTSSRDAFSHDQDMQKWNAIRAEWEQVGPGGDGTVATYVHRADLWEDFRLLLSLSPAMPVREVRLCKGSDDPATPALSLVLRDGIAHLRHGDMAERIPVGDDGDLSFERLADHMLIRARGEIVRIIPGGTKDYWRVALVAASPPGKWSHTVSLHANGVRDYRFRRAPVDWLPVSGRWDVTYRWQCDPRWSFHTGRHLAGTALNWFRFTTGENVSLEFFAAPRMNRERGEDYSYAADLNATVAAKGFRIERGWSFLYGGLGNRGSQIAAGGRILHENPSMTIPADKKTTHRHWFHVKIRRRGEHIAWWVDGKEAGVGEVPVGQGGDQLGLWTWRNEMVVGRVRVSSDSLVRMTGAMEAEAMAARPGRSYPVSSPGGGVDR